MDDESSLSAEQFRRAVLQSLASWQEAGVLQLPRAEVPAAPTKIPSSQPVALAKQEEPQLAKKKTPPPQPAPQLLIPSDPLTSSPSLSLDARCGALDALKQEVAGCVKCAALAKTRTQTVFGVGNPQARVCFLGEAPGADEDRQGEPFVGRAGKLLNDILAACSWKRSDVYILNILKCRPPQNRNPSDEEADNCSGFLARQLEIIQPEFICCLGLIAAKNLLKTTQSIGRMRGSVHPYRGAKVVCTYHPAYLLRNPSAKKDTWDDMKLLMKEMGVTPPK